MHAVSSEKTCDPGVRLVEDLLRELRERAVAAGDQREVRLVETPSSWILLGSDAFKIKKPLKLPFVDLSTFEARERACRNEVRINRRLAPRTYLGVLPIRRRPNGGVTLLSARGAIVEWAVRMNRLDDTRTADALLARDELRTEHVDVLAALIASFHADSPSGPRIVRCAAPDLIERHVRENFDALRESEAVDPALLTELERWQIAFVRGHRELFEARMQDGAVRDGHGDLRLEHVFVRPDGDFEIIDGIEFDDRYRWGDVAADVAFLAMDFARLGRPDFAERFIASYARASDDYTLYRVIDFYESYRACVRAKISAVDARRCLLLAESAMRRRVVEPALIVVGGAIASGKSALAEQLAAATAAPIVDAEHTRRHLLRAAGSPGASSEAVYDALLRRAAAVLASGRSVVLDASFGTAKARAAARALASEHNVLFRLVECVAPPDITHARLAVREPELRHGLVSTFEPIEELCSTEHIRVDTSGSLAAASAQALAVLPTWPTGLVC